MLLFSSANFMYANKCSIVTAIKLNDSFEVLSNIDL